MANQHIDIIKNIIKATDPEMDSVKVDRISTSIYNEIVAHDLETIIKIKNENEDIRQHCITHDTYKRLLEANRCEIAEEILIYLVNFLHNQIDSLTKYNLMAELVKLATQYEVTIQ